MLKKFYDSFHPLVEDTNNISRADVGNIRELGKDPESGKPVYARLGRFGPIIQIGEQNEDENEKPRFASLIKGQFLESIKLDAALELFKLPREVGAFENKPITAAIGKFGPYIRHDNKFVSLGDEDPMQITEERSIELIEQKRKIESESIIKTFDNDPDVKVLKGRYGPYVKFGKKNLKIPRDKIPEDLTYDECLELSKNAPAKKKKFKRK